MPQGSARCLHGAVMPVLSCHFGAMMPINNKDLINKPCPNCGRMEWKIGELLDSGGQRRYPWFCGVCGMRTQLYVKKLVGEREKAKQLADLQVETCEVCGAFGAQRHHWAPKAIFGEEESEKWPTGYLCQPCHSRWHKRWHKLMSANVKLG